MDEKQHDLQAENAGQVFLRLDGCSGRKRKSRRRSEALGGCDTDAVSARMAKGDKAVSGGVCKLNVRGGNRFFVWLFTICVLMVIAFTLSFTLSNLSSSKTATGTISFAINGHKGMISVENTMIRYDTTTNTNTFTLSPMAGYDLPTSLSAYILTSEPTDALWANAPSGWQSNNSVITFSGGVVKVYDTTLMSAGATALYITGECVPKTYTISYNANGGSGTAMATTTATVDQNIVLSSNTYTRTGYKFVGWGISETSNVVYKANETIPASCFGSTQNVTLYAVWEGVDYVVVLDCQNAEESGTELLVATYGSSMPSIQIPTRIGYDFNGYYTATSGGGVQYYNASGVSTNKYSITSQTTLYANWIRRTSTITFNLNDDGLKKTPSLNTASVTINGADVASTLALPNVPSYYVFKGWSYDANCSDSTLVTNASGACVGSWTNYITNGKWEAKGDFTLYAYWVQEYPDYTYISTASEWSSKGSTGNYMVINDLAVSVSYSSVPTFSGVLDGQGFTITPTFSANLYTTSLMGNNQGTIRNLNIANASIVLDYSSYSTDINFDLGLLARSIRGRLRMSR